MSVSSMVHRSAGGSQTVRSAVNDDALPEPAADVSDDAAAAVATVEDAAERPAHRDPVVSDKDLPDCKVRRNYTCFNCDFFTQNPRLYLYHLRDVHNERLRIYECPNCLYASKHFQKLLRHSKMVHGSSDGMSAAETSRKSRKRPSEELEDIEQMFNNEEAPLPTPPPPPPPVDEDPATVVEAEEDLERPAAFKCSVCAFVSRSRVLLGRHEREEHIKTKFFRCSKCTYVTHIKARYTKHVKYHFMPMIKCDMCDFRTPYKWNLDRHCKNHNGKGAFRCSACNFTADIKQSLTVHEMNHHVPPVGQAAGLGVGRRRNKVGASDTTAAEDIAATSQDSSQVTARLEEAPSDAVTIKEEPQVLPRSSSRPKIKITPKKIKQLPSGVVPEGPRAKHSDFIHPDDIIHHANGKVYIKNKCKLCNFKTAWDSEMAKHEKKLHNIDRGVTEKTTLKKNHRPIPNLIPIPAPSLLKRVPNLRTVEFPEPREPTMSEKDIKAICSRSANSALKDMASLFGSEDVFKNESTSQVPDLFPLQIKVKKTKPKNASFFDQFNQELGTTSNLICNLCGHESKCLTEKVKHQKQCGKETTKVPNIIPVHNISASRCQYCRLRCKSSADLHVHVQTCEDALRALMKQEDDASSEHENELKIDEDRQSLEDDYENKPHPMENKVFVWNDITVPMDIEVDDSNYEYTDDKNDDNVSLDLSMWSQSPAFSDNSSAGQENNNNLNTNNNLHTHIRNSPVPPTEKIPTHGNDISVAQHKRVFKCPHCTFWASTASRFHVHIVGHLNRKPFECSLCSYRSNWRWDITKHIKLKSVRDHAHETAKVLMTDETGRRNYSKYNKYLTEIPLSSLQSLSETSGGSGTRPKNYDKNSSPSTSKLDKPKFPTSGDLNTLLKMGNSKPPPALKAVDKNFLSSLSQEKKKSMSDSKRTLFKCKKCNFRDASRDILLQHVKAHYQQLSHQEQQQQFFQQSVAVTVRPSFLSAAAAGTSGSSLFSSQDLSLRGRSPDRDEASVNNSNVTKSNGTTHAPFRCGHCNQVSNWKHVIQRHCRLKHNGDIRVVSTKNGQEKIEIEEQPEEPDFSDVQQSGTFKCSMCPFATDAEDKYSSHVSCHASNPDNTIKCYFCTYSVGEESNLLDHLKLHGVCDPFEFVKSMNSCDSEGKKFRCVLCPYVTNTKTQYNYHKQFHKDRGGQYTCTQCSYNVSKRHLLHQHLKVHGIIVSPLKQNGEAMDVDEINSEIEEVPLNNSKIVSELSDIPLVWVLKDQKFTKMFKCRYCPHVNLRKVNIQEHEKMHNPRDLTANSPKVNDMEHRCVECNYICKNAGVLSSHLKVHQGLYGTVHSVVDASKTDEEQLRELNKELSSSFDGIDTSEFLEVEMEEPGTDYYDSVLYFCEDCPARFLHKTEHNIHRKFHKCELSFKCHWCSYAAEEKVHLLPHLKVHTAEYQERTESLKNLYSISPEHPEPELKSHTLPNDEVMFEVSFKSDIEKKNNILASFLNKPLKSAAVPLSSSDLFYRSIENEEKQHAEADDVTQDAESLSLRSPPDHIDVSVQGNPNFVYQKYVKNGRMKEKRYKCHKCPSAFEKKEQYKIHLGLHGSKQRYNCESCNYSVKYYANYVQHAKKHKFSEDAQAEIKRSSDGGDEENEEANESMEVSNDIPYECDDGSLKLSVADQQIQHIVEQRKSNSSSPTTDDKKTYYCPHCPYSSARRDALDSHQKRHCCVSGLRSAYACEHCDYSVPQAHFLRDHTKIHFIPNKTNHLDGYMICDNLKLTSSKIKASNVKSEDDYVMFDEEDSDDAKFNNNKGEKKLPNVQSRDLISDKANELNQEKH